MCFYIDPKHPKAKIAKKDIECFKTLDEVEENNVLSYYSPYRYFEYIFGVIYHVNEFNLVGSRIFNTYAIHKGLHSYSTLKRAKRKVFSYGVVCKTIIPKGATYYYNSERHEYVSTQLIVVVPILKAGKTYFNSQTRFEKLDYKH